MNGRRWVLVIKYVTAHEDVLRVNYQTLHPEYTKYEVAHHFMEKGRANSTVYRHLKTLNLGQESYIVNRKKIKAVVVTSTKRRKWVTMFDNKDGISSGHAASKFGRSKICVVKTF